jgi:hypothetical protein
MRSPLSHTKYVILTFCILAICHIGACTVAESPRSEDTSVTPDLLGPADSLDTDTSDSAHPDPSEVELEPASPVLIRLTQTQLRHAFIDLFGDDLTRPASLEPDAPADGLLTAGGSVNAVSPRGVELYEDAALSLGTQAVATPERLARIVPCDPATPSCLSTFIRDFGRLAWRRPLTADEQAALLALASRAREALGRFEDAVAWTVTALLQSPNFIYRHELGEPDPDADSPESLRYTSVEMASRLAFFLWASPPDAALLTAAEAGDLVTDAGLEATLDRMLADPRSARAIRTFFTEWLALYKLPRLNKDPNIFKHFSPDLGDLAAEETLRLIDHLFVTGDADLSDLLLTHTTFVDRRLAAIYNIEAPALDGFGRVDFDPAGERRGLLGQVSFLALHSHPTSSSATLRGAFLRQTLLCESVPPPPSNLNTAIPEPTTAAPTLRDRLAAHREDPSCASCHAKMDVPGLGLERFDGLGRHRLTENGAPIDPSGTFDGAPFRDASELAERVAASPKFTRCAVAKLYTFGNARPVEDAEEPLLEALVADFEAHDRSVRHLMKKIAMSPGFRKVQALEEDSP